MGDAFPGRPLLVMLVGLPRAGKSTAAARMREYAPVVCVDQIRLALHGRRFIASADPIVWAIAKLMVHALCGAGHHRVVLDATNTVRARRDEWIDPAWDRLFVVVNTPAAVCLERARRVGDTEMVSVIERMAAAYEPVASDEGPVESIGYVP